MVSNQDVSLWDFLPSEIKEMIWKYKLRLEKQELGRTTAHANRQTIHRELLAFVRGRFE